MIEFQFTTDWFEVTAKPIWKKFIPQIKPTKILEVGSYEGASACYLIGALANDLDIEIHCIDNWEGGAEHKASHDDMHLVESRFKSNIALAIENATKKVELVVHKGFSDVCLARLLADKKKNYFDFVYIDGSHQAPDVLCDAVFGSKLLRVGGFMVFDDYLWTEGGSCAGDPLRCPKPAIDAFVNIHFHKLKLVGFPLTQLCVQKLSD